MATVLITGANRGIGLEFARQYSADGWDVIATARDPGSADELNQLKVRVEQLELRDLAAVAAFGDRVDGPLDLLIANAGTMTPEEARTAEDGRGWAEMLTINSIAPYLLARSCLDAVAKAKGKLIAITSGMGSIGESSGGYVPYRSSKAALNMAWHSLAIETKRLGVVAVVLDPGWVKTRMGGRSAPTPPEHSVADMRKLIDRLTPDESGNFLKRDGTRHSW
jgi:NAD(P)-dependent dehydrogenase (short-subunit alcohol dehydrogenase family)